jgi:hypothetical protein
VDHLEIGMYFKSKRSGGLEAPIGATPGRRPGKALILMADSGRSDGQACLIGLSTTRETNASSTTFSGTAASSCGPKAFRLRGPLCTSDYSILNGSAHGSFGAPI